MTQSRYKTIKVKGKSRLLHRYLMEQHLGRKLTSNEVVHHKNEDKRDNRLENLEVLTHQEHVDYHLGKHAKDKTCEVCGAAYTPHKTKRLRQQTCSWECRSKLIASRVGKLSTADVEAIRARYLAGGVTLAEVGASFGVTKTTVSRIVRGKTWKADYGASPPVARALVAANLSPAQGAP